MEEIDSKQITELEHQNLIEQLKYDQKFIFKKKTQRVAYDFFLSLLHF